MNNPARQIMLCSLVILYSIVNIFTGTAQNLVVNINTLGREEGLSNTINAFFYRDHYGFVWISSIDGLNRFDGRHVRVYRCNPDSSNAIYGSNIQSPFFENKAGDIWFATELSINCYRRTTGDFEHFFVLDDDKLLSNINYYAFELDKEGFLWIIANNRYYLFNTNAPLSSAQKISADTTIACRAALSKLNFQETLLVGCYWENGPGFESWTLNQYSQAKRKDIHPTLSDKFIQAPVKTMAVQIESDTETWLATNKGLLMYNPANPKKSVCYPLPGEYNGVSALQSYNDGNLLTISRRGEIICFNKKSHLYSSPILHFDRVNKVSAPLLAQSIWMDHENVLWTSDNNVGIKYANLKNKGFKQIYKCDKNHTLSSSQLFEDNSGNIWCIAADGNTIVIDKQQNATQISLPEGSKMYQTANRKQYLFLTQPLRVTNKFLKTFENFGFFPSMGNTYYGFAPLDDEYVLMGTFSKLFYLKADGGLPQQINQIKQDVFQLFVDSNHVVWLGGGDNIQAYKVGLNKEFNLIKTLTGTGLVLHFYKDNHHANKLWAATANGLVEIDINSLTCTFINEQSGLPNQYVYAVTQDKKGNLWLSTNQGIISFNPDVKPYRFKQYTTRDGLSSNEFNPGAVLTDSRGYIWFGHTQGIDVFHPDSIRDLGHAPQLAIVSLKIHDHEWHGDSSIEVIQRLELPYNQNTLRLELAAMEYLDPEHNKFKVLLQLAGEQAQWTDLGTQNFVTYANLKPGNYTFKFIACNAEEIWVDEKNARVLHIVIYPHWSDTWWFRALLGGLILGFVAAVTAFYYRYQLRAQQLQTEKIQREAERQRLELEKTAALADGQRKVAESEMKLLRSQLNPHFLFNAMNSINRYILSNERDKASEYLGQFAQLTRNILDNSRTMTIPLADELAMLHNYLALENHRFHQQIHWTFTIAPDVDEEELLVPSMILQPFAENAILHGLAPKGGGHIAVEISLHDNALQCIIRDDGVGRGSKGPVTGKHSSVGMRLIEERLDAFGELNAQAATFVIVDLKDADGHAIGTEVVIRLPILG